VLKQPSRLRDIVAGIDYGLLAIVALPILLAWVNKNWFFNYPTIIDPWVYLGYFLRFKQYLIAFAGTYYGSRLSWIIPGYLTYKWLPPLIANYVLHLVFYYGATVAMYWTLKQTVGRRAALVATVFMGSYSYFLLAVGWNYVDGAGITYFLLVTLMLTNAALRERSRLFLLGGGIFYGALLYTNIFWIVLSPTFAGYYLLLQCRRKQSLKPANLILSAVDFAIGFLLITILLGGINYAVSQQFFFYLPSLNMAATYPNKPNPARAELKNWLPYATWLLLPLFTFLGSVIILLRDRRRRTGTQFGISLNSTASIWQLYFISNLLFLLLIHLAVNPILQFFYYASFLIPSIFLAFGAQISPLIDTLKKRDYVLFAAVTYSLLVLAYTPFIDSSKLYFAGVIAIVCLLALWAFFFVTKGNSRRSWLHCAGLIGIFAVFCFTNQPNWQLILGNAPSNRIPVLLKPDDTASRSGQFGATAENEFLATVKTQAILKAVDPEAKFLFWYNLEEAAVYRAIASASLWGYRLVGEKFPTLEPPVVNPDQPPDRTRLIALLKQHSHVVILSRQQDAFQQAIRSFAEVGFDVKFQAKFDIQQGEISYSMIAIEATAKPAAIPSSRQ